MPAVFRISHFTFLASLILNTIFLVLFFTRYGDLSVSSTLKPIQLQYVGKIDDQIAIGNLVQHDDIEVLDSAIKKMLEKTHSNLLSIKKEQAFIQTETELLEREIVHVMEIIAKFQDEPPDEDAKREESIQAPVEQFDMKENGSINTVKTILMVPNGEGKNRGVIKDVGFFAQKCESEKLCQVTDDVNLLGPGSIDKFEALVYKVKYFRTDQKAKQVIFPNRSESQRYVLYAHESSQDDLIPQLINTHLAKNFFNWTWTYKFDSDIKEFFGNAYAKNDDPPPFVPFHDSGSPKGAAVDMVSKTKAAFWFAQTCYGENFREMYVKALKKHVSIDDYGDCYDKTCPKGDPVACFFDSSSYYYFFLAFENSNCPGYATEELYKALENPIVPIVMGGSNYSQFLPEGSFIDVNDFDTVEDLADYLKELMADEAAYLKYFEWKSQYKYYKIDPLCQLCAKLHNPDEPAKTYTNVSKWFYNDDLGEPFCKNGSERSYYQSMFE